MSKQAISLEAQPREKLGTRTTRRLRRTGQLPAVVYGHKQEPVSISLPHKETVRHLMAGSHLFDLQLSGSKETVLIKDVQYDHLGTEIIHIDLARVDLTEKVTVTIPLHFKGTPDSTVSGIVSHDLADLEVECLVTEIPEGITVDVSGMKDGGHIAVHDLKLPAGVTAVTEGDVSVAHVAAVGTQVDDEAALEATDEPEVIAKGKGEEEGDEKVKLIVGLGNPGSAYVGTRHNVGFEVIDLIAERMGWLPPGQYERLARSQFSALTFEAVLGTEKVMLMKPTTFMNESGRAVQAAAAFYKLDPVQDLLVILDDLALPCGRIRLKAGGSDGGHNGLRSINRSFGHTQYPRLRIGIDPVPGKMAGADYVLGKWTADQRERLDLGRAAGCVTAWVNDGVEKTANAFNVDPNAEPPKPTESAKPTEPKKQTEE